MPISITQAQKGNRMIGAEFGETDYVELVSLKTDLEMWADKFITNMAASARKYKVVASGKMIGEAEPVIIDDGKGFQIWMVNYYDYPNKGVRGVMSTKNAPNSPYKFKSLYTMSDEGRRSIKTYIQQGKAKIRTVKNDKTLTGLERKKISLIDAQVNDFIFNVKKYGIKQTGYFDEAVEKTFNNEFYVSIAESIGNDIVFTLKRF